MCRCNAVQAAAAICSLWIFLVGAPPSLASEAISLKVGHAERLQLAVQAHTVTVGDAEIASASIAFGDILMLIGKNPGTTNLVALDADGRLIENVTLRVVRADSLKTIDIVRGGNRRTYVCGPEPGCLYVPPETQAVDFNQTNDPARGADSAFD